MWGNPIKNVQNKQRMDLLTVLWVHQSRNRTDDSGRQVCREDYRPWPAVHPGSVYIQSHWKSLPTPHTLVTVCSNFSPQVGDTDLCMPRPLSGVGGVQATLLLPYGTTALLFITTLLHYYIPVYYSLVTVLYCCLFEWEHTRRIMHLLHSKKNVTLSMSLIACIQTQCRLYIYCTYTVHTCVHKRAIIMLSEETTPLYYWRCRFYEHITMSSNLKVQ